MADIFSRQCDELVARSNLNPPVSGVATATAGSVGTGSEAFVGSQPPTKRQRKRQRDKSRKRRIFKESFELKDVLTVKEKESTVMEDELMTLRAKKGLLER